MHARVLRSDAKFPCLIKEFLTLEGPGTLCKFGDQSRGYWLLKADFMCLVGKQLVGVVMVKFDDAHTFNFLTCALSP